ncbi:tumor necrosis factor receptor superfamily member 13C [Echinops telfairi]|uniref:Tumor necrosis factor receptor superfamily member 13C n=1 Tax=Echinops telfairi TaxID=9371 RepID=A0ABM0IIG0_ECHTE|nr:tumor necrosis factor receptor superfamily member 13C [Echinops telfairi]
MARGGAGSFGGREGPAPTQCGEALCFDLLVRVCVACKLFRTPKPSPEPLDHVIVLSLGPTNATAPVWPPPEDPDTTPPGHSVPVPATELGSTELVTTKTAGPEQL